MVNPGQRPTLWRVCLGQSLSIRLQVKFWFYKLSRSFLSINGFPVSCLWMVNPGWTWSMSLKRRIKNIKQNKTKQRKKQTNTSCRHHFCEQVIALCAILSTPFWQARHRHLCYLVITICVVPRDSACLLLLQGQKATNLPSVQMQICVRRRDLFSDVTLLVRLLLGLSVGHICC